jgi:hypothetical protein
MIAITEHLDRGGPRLDQTRREQCIDVDGVTGRETLLETRHVDHDVLGAEPVLEAPQLRKAHVERVLPTLETGTLSAARAGELALVAPAARTAVAGTVPAADTLGVLAGPGCREEIV